MGLSGDGGWPGKIVAGISVRFCMAGTGVGGFGFSFREERLAVVDKDIRLSHRPHSEYLCSHVQHCMSSIGEIKVLTLGKLPDYTWPLSQ